MTAANFIVAVGARARGLPGMEIDGDKVIQYRDAIVMDEVPEKLIVVGSGAIGMEFSYIYNAYGADVTVIEMLDQLLPLEDTDVADEVAKAFRRAKINTMVSTRTEKVELTDDGVNVTVKNLKDDSEEDAERRQGVGRHRRPTQYRWGEPGGGRHRRQSTRLCRSRRSDAHQRAQHLRHRRLHGQTGFGPCGQRHGAWLQPKPSPASRRCPLPMSVTQFMPRCTYCHPQVASLGMTEAQAKEAGYEINVGKFPFMPNGKAQALTSAAASSRSSADAQYGEILGAHMVGPDVTELLPELSLAQFMEITPDEIARTVHAHPTLSEVIMEAAHAVDGHPIHA